MENGRIKDAQITASSEYAGYFAIQARLNKFGGWVSTYKDANQWIQVSLGSFTNVTGIATQGNSATWQLVTKYLLQYGDDGVNFRYYKALCESFPKVNYTQVTISNCCTHSWHFRLQSSKHLNSFI